MVMSKKRQIAYLKRIASGYGVDPQLIDWEAEVDGSLEFKENKQKLLEKIKSLSNNEDKKFVFDKDVMEYYEQLATREEQEFFRKSFAESIEKIKNIQTPEMDKYYRTVKELIKITVKGGNNSLILISECGLGKTYQVLKTLSECGLTYGQDFIYINSHITPLELYNTLYKYRDKVVVLDDVETLFDNIITLGILKGATWESVNGMRVINWYSTTQKLNAPESFEFKGKIIMCLNKLPNKNKEIVNSLISRSLHYRIEFDYETKIKILYELAKILGIDFKICDFIRENTSPVNENLNLRTLILSNIIYQYYQANPSELNGKSWEVIVKETLLNTKNPELELVYKLINSGLSVKEQEKKFMEETNLSRRTFYNLKKKLVQKCNQNT
jgi:hypothetical protein